MAVLTDNDRVDIWREYMRYGSNERETMGLTKPELRAAIDATDDWINDNQASYNNALPTAAKASLTQKQKVRLFLAVAEKRFDVEA